MSRILITGASGFIGSNLARKLVKTQDLVSVVIRQETDPWRIKDILTDFDIYKVNLINGNQIKNLIKRCKPEIVYHCAACGINRTQKNDEQQIIETNINGTRNLLIALDEYGLINKLVNVGSYLEQTLKSDNNYRHSNSEKFDPYAFSKFYQTKLVQYFSNKRKIPAVTLRLFNPYGQFEDSGRSWLLPIY